MRLSGEELDEVIKKLAETWKTTKCPQCDGNSGWTVADRVFELREFNKGDLVVGGDSHVYPIVVVMCKACGYTILVNALHLNAVRRPGTPNGEASGHGE